MCQRHLVPAALHASGIWCQRHLAPAELGAKEKFKIGNISSLTVDISLHHYNLQSTPCPAHADLGGLANQRSSKLGNTTTNL